MKFDFDKYKDQKVVMHCKTEEEAIDFCRVMDEAGLRWKIGARYINRNFYDVYEELTCYVFNEGKYRRIDRALNNGYEVLEWSNFMNSRNEQFSKSDLRNGDVCVTRAGFSMISVIDLRCFAGDLNAYSFDDFSDDLKYEDHQLDIVKVYRPQSPYHCSLDFCSYESGELVFDRAEVEHVEVTLEEIAKLKGVSVDRIKIVKG